VIEVCSKGDALEFENCPRLVGRAPLLFGQGLDRSAACALGIVKDFAWRNDAPSGNLSIDGPVALQTIVRVNRRQPRRVAAAVGDKAIGIVRPETADCLAVVGVLFSGDVVVGKFRAGGNV
jgi:hypothetical protein